MKFKVPDLYRVEKIFGPPGTGKSMSADAIAKELGLPIIKVSYAELESKWLGFIQSLFINSLPTSLDSRANGSLIPSLQTSALGGKFATPLPPNLPTLVTI